MSDNLYRRFDDIVLVIAREIVLGKEINNDTLTEIVTKYHKEDKYSKMILTELVKDRKWNVQDLRCKSGIIKPFIIDIEKII